MNHGAAFRVKPWQYVHPGVGEGDRGASLNSNSATDRDRVCAKTFAGGACKEYHGREHWIWS
jgi:hypothetical protein